MHEMGIAASVLDIVRQYVPEARGPLVRRVTVRVGELAGVQTDSLRFCFEAIIAGTPYQSAALCRCGTEFPSAALLAACPACGSADATFVGGSELSVAEVELDDEHDSAGQVMP
jgi:hydrogenase nickel incorporation protein HypA/HybF